MSELLVEHCDSRGVKVRVDRSVGVIRGVKILGTESKNGRFYKVDALKRSIPLYEGARVNVDHPQGSANAPRAYEDRIGAVRNVRARADGLYGDFYFNPKHRLTEQLLWDAENTPENVGFSHNVLARTARQGGKTVVEEITRVQSVDLVADPATTHGLFEGDANEACGESQGTATSVWHNPSKTWVPFNQEKEAVMTTNDEDSHVELQALQESNRLLEAENQLLKEELDLLRDHVAAAELQARANRRIHAARLPQELDTEAFREQCYRATDEAELTRLIEARQEDAKLLQVARRPQSVEQHRAALYEHDVVDGATFAASIR